jgi:CO dehydrogenase nickel-insertion accessory protein CooC1
MALVTFSGYGASGKSTRALQLHKYLCEHQSKEVLIVNDNEGLHISRRAYDGPSISCETMRRVHLKLFRWQTVAPKRRPEQRSFRLSFAICTKTGSSYVMA